MYIKTFCEFVIDETVAEDQKAGSCSGVDSSENKHNFISDKIKEDIATGKFGGRIHTRFPPEPSGYLHIGHAKAICLNFGLAADFNGTCNLRFDDTNPETEDQDYVDGIIEDIAWLGFTPDGNITYTSDYFEQLYSWAEELITKGLAYVDDQDAETISTNRGGFTTPGVDSPWRDRTPEENLKLFRGMRAGEYEDGSKVLRAKIDMNHTNMWMRDPLLYRIRHVPHQRTGDTWKIYPTYDFAHGQSDAIEGITHSLCTLEFDDHRPLYNWLLDQLELPHEQPEQTEFARLNITHTVTSKRLLKKLTEDGAVGGWDDPRMPTLRGMRRAGYPPAAIRAFVEKVGVARVDGTNEVELLESFVRDELNQTALRRMAVLKPLKVVITNWPAGKTVMCTAANHPQDEMAGTRHVPFTGELWIEQDDFKVDPPPKYYRLTPGREVRLRSGFFITANDVVTDDEGNVIEVHCTYDPETQGGQAPDGRKVKATIHWVSAAHATDATVHLYDRLLSDPHPGADDTDPLSSCNPNSKTTLREAKLEPTLADVAPGDVVQFERLGYFAADLDDPKVFHRTVGLRDEWARLQKRNQNNKQGKQKKPL